MIIASFDAWLLARADRIVAWSRDRGSGDQWQFAYACLDAGMAMFVVKVLLGFREAGGQVVTTFMDAMLLLLFVYLRTQQRRSIARHAASATGAARARVGEEHARHTNLLILIMLIGVAFIHPQASDAAFVAAIVSFDLALYFKAADPPPPAHRHEPSIQGA